MEDNDQLGCEISIWMIQITEQEESFRFCFLGFFCYHHAFLPSSNNNIAVLYETYDYNIYIYISPTKESVTIKVTGNNTEQIYKKIKKIKKQHEANFN